MGLITLQDIFCGAYPAYEHTHPLPAHVRRAARAIMQCRTAVLGGHVQACPDGHVSRIWYNSCRHRACPQCAYLQTERWLALQQARLLACDHYHVIFTLPHDLNPLWRANVSVMTTLFFQVVRDTLGTLLADPKYLGAQPGIIAALHTWSQTLLLQPPSQYHKFDSNGVLPLPPLAGTRAARHESPPSSGVASHGCGRGWFRFADPRLDGGAGSRTLPTRRTCHSRCPDTTGARGAPDALASRRY